MFFYQNFAKINLVLSTAAHVSLTMSFNTAPSTTTPPTLVFPSCSNIWQQDQIKGQLNEANFQLILWERPKLLVCGDRSNKISIKNLLDLNIWPSVPSTWLLFLSASVFSCKEISSKIIFGNSVPLILQIFLTIFFASLIFLFEMVP